MYHGPYLSLQWPHTIRLRVTDFFFLWDPIKSPVSGEEWQQLMIFSSSSRVTCLLDTCPYSHNPTLPASISINTFRNTLLAIEIKYGASHQPYTVHTHFWFCISSNLLVVPMWSDQGTQVQLKVRTLYPLASVQGTVSGNRLFPQLQHSFLSIRYHPLDITPRFLLLNQLCLFHSNPASTFPVLGL